MSDLRAVVTGGAGFIGSHLCEALVTEGWDVTALDDLSAGEQRVEFLEGIGVSLLRHDVRSDEAAEAVRRVKPSTIFHLAAQMDVRRSVADPSFDASVNILGTLNLLKDIQFLVTEDIRFVFASSGGCIYGEPAPEDLPVKESHIGRPTSPYGISKRVVEDYLRLFGDWDLQFVSLALANVYGPRQDPHGEGGVVSIFGSRLLSGEPCLIYGDGNQTRDFVYVGDVAKAFVQAALAGGNETFNIGTGIETSINDLYETMAKLTGVESPPIYKEARPGELQRSVLDCTKANTSLIWQAQTPLEEGLQKTLDWLKTEA